MNTVIARVSYERIIMIVIIYIRDHACHDFIYRFYLSRSMQFLNESTSRGIKDYAQEFILDNLKSI